VTDAVFCLAIGVWLFLSERFLDSTVSVLVGGCGACLIGVIENHLNRNRPRLSFEDDRDTAPQFGSPAPRVGGVRQGAGVPS
jgi:hypothetical protein